ncbi:transcriptional regulator [Sphaerisporangium krabiense]|uniref:Transcriptional regulator with XRE-family HTH domain n=1 Tax=Sphaerisporangium krabiense TaxID=763782 RepID=A0A7W9DPF7_9ACTN|nr:helix-turn-helix domain-containing protein [Sphaerisporangium krabiense]MBB5626392.1 transcriptional regulator with XRE-family HTH domain [Sphaerisporangium krabiense]GII63310.1 transcriptional regulator [Sphaerisporangium krabiense]
MTTTALSRRPVGELLRQWREHRRLSQLDLSIQADISTRHLSFLETGRSKPSRDMVLHLAEELDLPLRERNRLLLAAGFAPEFSETTLDAPRMTAVRTALRQILAGHEPYPAVVVDGRWNLVEGNVSLGLLTSLVDPELLAAPANVLRASMHPKGLAPHIVNLGEWRSHLLGRLRRQIAFSADPELEALYAEIRAYPCDQPEPEEAELAGAGELVVPLRLRHDAGELAFFSTIATFGTPLDITLAELAIESFFPADRRTAEVLRSAARTSPAAL